MHQDSPTHTLSLTRTEQVGLHFVDADSLADVAFESRDRITAKDTIEECLKEWMVDHVANSDKKMALMVQGYT